MPATPSRRRGNDAYDTMSGETTATVWLVLYVIALVSSLVIEPAGNELTVKIAALW
jgi:hypothetical protein